MANYFQLSNEIRLKIESDKSKNSLSPFAFKCEDAVRRIDNPHDYPSVIRNAFVRDVDKILHCPFYNRYSDKTQVFSLNKNDDIARRGLHVQLVSRIARTIGDALNLNLDLIEAIALGHDLGHTPFGHTGEYILDQLLNERISIRFAHNVHSVRVLDNIFPTNVTLQTLDGIICHNGEIELSEYRPIKGATFASLDEDVIKCNQDLEHVKKLIPSTLEGCVVRISDIIAYLGKDRYDAQKSNIDLQAFSDYGIGTTNAEIIHNLTVNVVENSYGKPFIKMDEKVYDALKSCKKDNYDAIYKNPIIKNHDQVIEKMMAELYDELLSDLINSNRNSPIYAHHIDYLTKPYYKRERPYIENAPHQIVVDYIAGMTDDYFIDLYRHLFPKKTVKIEYKGYFD